MLHYITHQINTKYNLTCLGEAIFGSCPSYSPCPGLGLCGGGPGGSLVMSRDISGEKGEEV